MSDFSPNTVLVTGASGFIGSKLLESLSRQFQKVFAIQRGVAQAEFGNVQHVTSDLADLHSDLFEGERISTFIHLAAHVPIDRSVESKHICHRVNVRYTETLANIAIASGASRFIFISTIKVHGEVSFKGNPISPCSPMNPKSHYARSKLQAERLLKEKFSDTDIELVILRPVLVYGHGIKGNLRLLCGLANKFRILPLGSIANRRSLVSVENLIEAIMNVAKYKNVASGDYVISDDQVLSTPEILFCLVNNKDRCKIINFPTFMLKLLFLILGKGKSSASFFESLEVDNSLFKEKFNWAPSVNTYVGLKAVCDK